MDTVAKAEAQTPNDSANEQKISRLNVLNELFLPKLKLQNGA